MSGISIIVPVGPNPAYLLYLDECLESIRGQMGPEDEIVIVDDMANLMDNTKWRGHWQPTSEQYIANPWLLGCADSWNIGVARATNEWCILMGSDDTLKPDCLSSCRELLAGEHDPFGYYNFTLEMQNGEKNDSFNNAALVSKALWKATGGFPPSAGVGAPDALLISIMLVHLPHRLHQLRQGHPLYWCRQHPDQDTIRQGVFYWEAIAIRNFETARWTPPEWTR